MGSVRCDFNGIYGMEEMSEEKSIHVKIVWSNTWALTHSDHTYLYCVYRNSRIKMFAYHIYDIYWRNKKKEICGFSDSLSSQILRLIYCKHKNDKEKEKILFPFPIFMGHFRHQYHLLFKLPKHTVLHMLFYPFIYMIDIFVRPMWHIPIDFHNKIAL